VKLKLKDEKQIDGGLLGVVSKSWCSIGYGAVAELQRG